MSQINKIYIIDSSALIHLRKINPIDIYKTPWERLKELMVDGRLITHSQVYDEVTDGEDFLVDWVREQSREYEWICELTDYQNFIIPSVHETYPRFIKPENKHDADPFVIALALDKINNPLGQATLTKNEYTVVSEEISAKHQNLENPPEVVKIPDFCKIFGIECIRLFEMFRREAWEF